MLLTVKRKLNEPAHDLKGRTWLHELKRMITNLFSYKFVSINRIPSEKSDP